MIGEDTDLNLMFYYCYAAWCEAASVFLLYQIYQHFHYVGT